MEHFGSRWGKQNIQHSRGFTCLLKDKHIIKCPVGPRPSCLVPLQRQHENGGVGREVLSHAITTSAGNDCGALALSPFPFFFFVDCTGNFPNWFGKSPRRTEAYVLQAHGKALVDLIGTGFDGCFLESTQKGISVLWKGKCFGGKGKALLAAQRMYLHSSGTISCHVGSGVVCSSTSGSCRLRWAAGHGALTAQRLQPGAAARPSRGTPSSSVPAFPVPCHPATGRCDRAWTCVCCGTSFTSKLKSIINFAHDRRCFCAGSHDLANLKPKIHRFSCH